MLEALLQRLRLAYFEDGMEVKTYAERIQERQQLKAELQQEKEKAQATIDQIAEMESEMDYHDAMEPGDPGEGEGDE